MEVDVLHCIPVIGNNVLIMHWTIKAFFRLRQTFKLDKT